ncbi:hypothetical protein DMENIID0001_082940 [Sergentomyia squamirostris]
MTRCAYEGCNNLYVPCSRLTFFNLPKNDKRREVWVANSGNEQLMREYRKNNNVRRLFCEKHFKDQHKKCQFNRTTLRQDAVPFIYDMNLAEAFLLKDKGDVIFLKQEVDSCEEYLSEDVPVAIVAPQNNQEEEKNMDESESIEYVNFIEDEESEKDISENSLAIQTVNKMIKNYSTTKPFQKKEHFVITDIDDEIIETIEASSQEDVEKDIMEEDESILNPAEEFLGNEENALQERVEQVEPPPGHLEEDRYFVLSLLSPLSKLTCEQRAIAKVNILKYLLELEVGKKNAIL